MKCNQYKTNRTIFSLLALFAITAMPAAHAVAVKNYSNQPFTLENFSFISGIEPWMYPVTLEPGKLWERNDIAKFTVTTLDKAASQPFENLTDDTLIIIKGLSSKGEIKAKVFDQPKEKEKKMKKQKSSAISSATPEAGCKRCQRKAKRQNKQ